MEEISHSHYDVTLVSGQKILKNLTLPLFSINMFDIYKMVEVQ